MTNRLFPCQSRLVWDLNLDFSTGGVPGRLAHNASIVPSLLRQDSPSAQYDSGQRCGGRRGCSPLFDSPLCVLRWPGCCGVELQTPASLPPLPPALSVQSCPWQYSPVHAHPCFLPDGAGCSCFVLAGQKRVAGSSLCLLQASLSLPLFPLSRPSAPGPLTHHRALRRDTVDQPWGLCVRSSPQCPAVICL